MIFLITASVVMIILSYSQKYIYRHIPSDYNRHMLLFDVLNEEPTNPNIVVFGDSRTMFGVDTRIIEENLGFTGEVYNLSSVGQSLYEAGYYYTMVKNNTAAVIQCISPSFFSSDIENNLSNEKAISMFLSGYRINAKTKELIKDYNHFFNRKSMLNYFASRSYFKSYLNNMLRPFFDNEQFDETVRLSKYFPHIYTQDKHPNYPVYEYNCKEYIRLESPTSQLNFLSDVNRYYNDRNVKYIIVFMPVNPDECKDCYQDFKEYARLIEEKTDIKVINLSDYILDTKYFYDAMHANIDGAKLLSSEIGVQLRIILKRSDLSAKNRTIPD